MTIIVYGLRNCDTCRKVLKALAAAGHEHAFIDVRADGVSGEQIGKWAAQVGWQRLLNRRGTTWRGLDAAATANLDEARAVALMAEHPALIKRPVFETGDRVLVGFDPEVHAVLGLA
jgi:arsenate reductase